MKFGNEIERDSTPEWQVKYLDYKTAKKKLSSVSRAYRAARYSPSSFLRGAKETPDFTSPFQSGPVRDLLRSTREQERHDGEAHDELGNSNGAGLAKGSARSPAADSSRPTGDLTKYGSISRTPSLRTRTNETTFSDNTIPGPPPSLHLPDPALHGVNSHLSTGDGISSSAQGHKHMAADSAGKKIHPHGPGSEQSPLVARHKFPFGPRRTASTPGHAGRRPTFLKRVMSLAGNKPLPRQQQEDVEMAAGREFDVRKDEFFEFLNQELAKIDEFYREKESEANSRLAILREQLQIMAYEKRRKSAAAVRKAKRAATEGDIDPLETRFPKTLKKTIRRTIEEASRVVPGSHASKEGKTDDVLTPRSRTTDDIYDNRDYGRKPPQFNVRHDIARRKLKLALQEYYRGLELLKAYALLNRKGFRKINKKYDKAVDARQPLVYLTEIVDKSWFVQSNVLEKLIQEVESLYADSFERGKRKIAAGKLRAKTTKADHTGSVFRSGLWLSAGAVFGVQGLVYGAELLFSGDAKLVADTSFLLQLYAGYFLMNLLIVLFCLACRFWSYSKINYVFVFEFDPQHHLDWRELSELPSFAMFLLGFFLWLNFTRYGADDMYIYYPVILIGLTLCILFLPIPYIYHRMRLWFLFSNWRLLLGGTFYPVEFRDFFLGDMYCSETYAMGNIEVFFCLYANDWTNHATCNSTHSRLLGFFSALPGVWRAMQCLRRYYDTRNIFPHLVNCGKYMMTICYYMTLSIFRISKTTETKALFIAFATINAVYCTIWDLVMDWSLLDPYAKHKYLRDTLGFKQIWLYYLAIVVDPILRFNWIFYAIFADDVQHSAVLSFAVALSEVGRRALWMLFRVENEHCTNVGRFRASRDIALPYDLITEHSGESSRRQSLGRPSTESRTTETRDSSTPILSPTVRQQTTSGQDVATATGKGTDAAQTPVSPSQTLRRRPQKSGSNSASPVVSRVTPTLRAVGSIMRMAHAQDYSRKKPADQPESGDESSDDDNDGYRAAQDLEAQLEAVHMREGEEAVNDEVQGFSGHGSIDGSPGSANTGTSSNRNKTRNQS